MAIALELPARTHSPHAHGTNTSETGDFSRALKEQLEQRDFKLNSAELGRRGADRVWVISVTTPSDRVLEVHIKARDNEHPFDLDQAEDFAEILAEKFR